MSDLRSRLASLGYRVEPASQIGRPGPAAGPITPGADATPGERARPAGRRAFRHPVESVVEGSYLPTPHGDCFVAECHHPAGHPHGVHRLEEALEADPRVFPWLGREEALAAFDPARAVFLDVETTGLAGGSGTYAFLVGLGHFHGPRFVVRQLFMDDFDAEEALLHALAEALEPFDGVVTFNGRVFDLPLLETRFLMARRPFPLTEALHLDLLFPARRVWRERLESCALGCLEREILGVEREGDVEGWEIPGLYFDYLRARDARPLARVFEHNRHDLLSMAALVARLARQYADPFHPDHEDARDLSGLGAAFEALALADRAALCYERALALGLAPEAQERTMVRLGGLYKRLRQREDAVALWRRLASGGRTFTTVAHVELAKHYEHAARDYREAERITLQALAALETRALRSDPWRLDQERRDLDHRLARLRRKQGK